MRQWVRDAGGRWKIASAEASLTGSRRQHSRDGGSYERNRAHCRFLSKGAGFSGLVHACSCKLTIGAPHENLLHEIFSKEGTGTTYLETARQQS